LLPAKCFTSTTSFGWHQPYLNAVHDVVFQLGTRRNTWRYHWLNPRRRDVILAPRSSGCWQVFRLPNKMCALRTTSFPRKMALNVSTAHKLWLEAPGAKGQPHVDSRVRIVHLPPSKSRNGWDISEYRNRWNLVEQLMRAPWSAGPVAVKFAYSHHHAMGHGLRRHAPRSILPRPKGKPL